VGEPVFLVWCIGWGFSGWAKKKRCVLGVLFGFMLLCALVYVALCFGLWVFY
jgi:hypothetical protein